MEFDCGIECCALTELAQLPYDAVGESEWAKEKFKDDWADFIQDIRNTHGPAIAAVNRKQLNAKKELEKRRFKVVGTVQSEEGNGTIYIMARGFIIPRTKRGHHAKRK